MALSLIFIKQYLRRVQFSEACVAEADSMRQRTTAILQLALMIVLMGLRSCMLVAVPPHDKASQINRSS
jgi:hypothetical protein